MAAEPIRLVAPERPLSTERLLLEPLIETHAEAVFPSLRDERLYRYIPQEPPTTVEALAAVYARRSVPRSPDGREAWLNWVMRLRDAPGAYVGLLEATVAAERTAYVAYTVFVPHQRQGSAAEGLGRVLTHLFDDYGVAEVAAEVDTRNAASMALLERLRFARVGTTIGADFFKGASSDEHRYELRSWGAATSTGGA